MRAGGVGPGCRKETRRRLGAAGRLRMSERWRATAKPRTKRQWSLLGAFAAHFFGEAGNHFFGNVHVLRECFAGAKPVRQW